MAILPKAFVETHTIGTKTVKYYKPVFTGDGVTSWGAPGTNDTCCPTRITPCCEAGLATTLTTTATGTGGGAGGGRPLGVLTIIISGLCGSDKYINRLGNGIHKFCYKSGGKQTYVKTQVVPTSTITGTNYTGAYTSVFKQTNNRSLYTYFKRYSDGANKFTFFKKKRKVTFYSLNDFSQHCYNNTASNSLNERRKRVLAYKEDISAKTWRVDGSTGKIINYGWGRCDFNSMEFTWSTTIDDKAKNNYGLYHVCSPYPPYTVYGTPCTYRDLVTKRKYKRRKTGITTDKPWIRGRGTKHDTEFDTATATDVTQDFCYDMLHPNGYIFNVTFSTSGYVPPDRTDMITTFNESDWAPPQYLLNNNDLFKSVSNSNNQKNYSATNTAKNKTTTTCQNMFTTYFGYSVTRTYDTYRRYTRTTDFVASNFEAIHLKPTGDLGVGEPRFRTGYCGANTYWNCIGAGWGSPNVRWYV